MRRMLSLFLVLLLATSLTGCLSPDGAAAVPDEALKSKGWMEAGGEDAKAAANLVSYHIREYTPNGARAQFGRVVVVTAPDIPFLDEGNIVSEQLQQIAEREGFELSNPQQSTLELASGVEAGQTVYTVKNWDVGQAKLRKVEWSCNSADAYIAAIGYGVTSAGIDTSGTFRDTQDLIQSVPCP